MKVPVLALALTSAATLAVATPHAHNHLHRHKAKRDVTVTTNVPGPTAYAYVLDGQQIGVSEVCQGLADNELKFADGNAPSGICNPSTTTTTTTTPAPTTTTTTSPSSSASGGAFYQASASSSGSSGSTGATGIGADFPSGQVSCDTFPSAYGALSVPYLGLNGWIGVQKPTFAGNAISNIVTAIAGEGCSEGSLCSYACSPGYQKSQWPTAQGSAGQSAGGLLCQGGMLHLTNTAYNTLCIPGEAAAGTVQVTNKGGQVLSVCRTDYPGTESETVPVEVDAGASQPLCIPNEDTYFQWKGLATSAQWYLNPFGVAASQACVWGTGSSDIGNWAPMNFGTGYRNGLTWLAMFPNAPTTTAEFQGTITLSGTGIARGCQYSGGSYCFLNSDGSVDQSSCSKAGCTVSMNPGGAATFAVSE